MIAEHSAYVTQLLRRGRMNLPAVRRLRALRHPPG